MVIQFWSSISKEILPKNWQFVVLLCWSSNVYFWGEKYPRIIPEFRSRLVVLHPRMPHSFATCDTVLGFQSHFITVYIVLCFVCLLDLLVIHACVNALLSASRLVQIQTLTLWTGALIYPTRGIMLCSLQSRGCRWEWISWRPQCQVAHTGQI